MSHPTPDTEVPGGFNERRGRFETRLSQPAEGGKENQEFVKVLEEFLGAKVR